jgi:hypothetical protein
VWCVGVYMVVRVRANVRGYCFVGNFFKKKFKQNLGKYMFRTSIFLVYKTVTKNLHEIWDYTRFEDQEPAQTVLLVVIEFIHTYK